MRIRPTVLLAIGVLGAIGLASLWVMKTTEVALACVVAIAGLGGKLLEKETNGQVNG